MKLSNQLQCFTIYFIILANGIATFSKNNGIEDTHVELLASGSKRVTSLPTKQNISTCLSNEYGPNCTYCVPHDSCINGHYSCDKNTGAKLCMPGWLGSNCQYEHGPEVNNYHVTCPESQCRNGGQCAHNRCCCISGFTGVLCEIEVIECQNDSCQNGGLCKDLVGNFTCICKPPFGGEYCERRIDTGPQTTTSRDSGCQKNTCKNKGRCFEDAYYTYCLCPTGFTGEHCEVDLHSNNTVNPGCPAHHYGDNCDVICNPVDSCHRGHFICEPATGNKICLSGWIGKNCDTRLLPQHLDPSCPRNLRCKNDGQCFHQECCCKHNYTGEICNVESIGCLSNPCVNNATCSPSGNGYRCECHQQYTGKQCETLISTSSTNTLMSPSPSPSTNLQPIHHTSSDPDIHRSAVSPKPTGTFISSLHISPTQTFSSIAKHSPSSITIEASSVVLLPSSSQLYSPYPDSIHSISTAPVVSSPLENTLLHSSLATAVTAIKQTISHTSQTTYIPPTESNLYLSTSNPMLQTSLITHSSSTTPIRTPSSDLSSISTKPAIPNDNATILTLAPSKSQFLYSTLSPSLAISAYETSSSSMSESSLLKHSNSPNYLSSTDSTPVNVMRTIVVPSNRPNSQVIQSSIQPGYTPAIKTTPTLKSSSLATGDLYISTSLPTPSISSVTPLANGSSINPTSTSTSTSVSGASATVNNIDDTSEGGSKTSKNSLSWWVILLIVAGVLFVLAVLLVIVITRIQQRRSDSRTLQRRPELIQNYDKEHFSAQPEFKNQGYDVQENDSDDDSIKQDTYVVNE